MIDELAKRLEALKASRQAWQQKIQEHQAAIAHATTQLHANDGAIQECELWLNVARAKKDDSPDDAA